MTAPRTDWRILSFTDVFTVASDGGRRVDQKDYRARGSIPVVDQGQDLVGGYTNDARLAFSGALPVIVFGDHTRRIKFIDFPFAVGAQGVKLLLPKSDLLPRYAYWLLQSIHISARGYARHFALLRKEKFPVPPLEEQRRIVDILEDHLSRLDAARSQLELAKARSRRLVSAALLTDPSVQAAASQPLAELLAEPLANGRSVPTREGGFPVLRLTALKDEGIDLTERKPGAWTRADAAPFLVRRGDYFVSRGNGSLRLVARGGHVTTTPDAVAYPDTFIRIRTRPDLLVPEYLHLVWNSPIVRRQIEAMARTTAGIYKVNQKHLERVRVPVPTSDQQKVIGKHIGDMSTASHRLLGEVGTASQRAVVLRRAVLAAAFSGRLTGRSSDLEVVEERAGV